MYGLGVGTFDSSCRERNETLSGIRIGVDAYVLQGDAPMQVDGEGLAPLSYQSTSALAWVDGEAPDAAQGTMHSPDPLAGHTSATPDLDASFAATQQVQYPWLRFMERRHQPLVGSAFFSRRTWQVTAAFLAGGGMQVREEAWGAMPNPLRPRDRERVRRAGVMLAQVRDIAHGASLRVSQVQIQEQEQDGRRVAAPPVNGTLLPYWPVLPGGNSTDALATAATGPCPASLGFDSATEGLCALWLVAGPSSADDEAPVRVRLNASICSSVQGGDSGGAGCGLAVNLYTGANETVNQTGEAPADWTIDVHVLPGAFAAVVGAPSSGGLVKAAGKNA